jgi:sulfide dehydrogenase cytochrome subunit
MLARAALAASLAVACSALAQPASPPPHFAPSNLAPANVRAMAADCAPCHGTDGHAAPGSAVASLAGKPRGEIVQAMVLFKEGRKPATVMHQIAKGFTEPEIEALDDYFSHQKAR